MRPKQLVRLTLSATTWLCLGCPGVADRLVDAVDAGTDGGYAYQTVFTTEHAAAITTLLQGPDRLISVDGSGHYNLWNVHAKSSLISGETRSAASLGGNLFVVQAPDFEVRDATDGHLVFAIPAATAATAAVASDGSYVWTASATEFQVLSATGSALFRVGGDYSHAAVFAAPGEVRIANGGKGTSTIELLAVPNGTSTTSPVLQGAFHSWFADGSQLLTLGGGVLHAYTKAGLAEGTILVPPSATKFGGLGDFVWLLEKNPPASSLKLYPTSGGATPTASFNVTGASSVVPAGSGLGVLYADTLAVDIVTVSGGRPATTRGTSTVPNPVAFAMDAGGTWSVGSDVGVVHYGDPLNAAAAGRLGYGMPLGIRGSGATGAAAIVAVGFPFKTLAFDLSATPVKQLAALDFGSRDLALSRDGTVLAATKASFFPYFTELTLKAFALPLGTELHAWPYTGGAYLHDFQLAAGGSRIARVIGTPDTQVFERHISDLSGLAILDDTGSSLLRLSPDGTEYADVAIPFTTMSATRLYRNGALVTGIDGTAAAWIDDGRILVNSYNAVPRISSWCTHSAIYDAAGNALALPQLPCQLRGFDYLPPGQLYSLGDDTIYDLRTGSASWKGPGWTSNIVKMGTVAGDSVLYVYGREIRRVQYR